MKNIQESFENISSISSYLENEEVNEGLKEIFATIKQKIKSAITYLKGIVAKFGVYYLPVNEEGEVMNAISPLTSGQAYKDGYINTSNTCVILDNEGSKIVGLKTKHNDALKLYGSGNSLHYWRRAIKECQDLQNINNVNEEKINEVRLQNSDPQAKYNVIVDNDKLKARIKMALKNKNLARLMIWGAPGIGKTAILMNVLEEMKKDFPDYRLIIKTLSNETPDNFTLPTYVDIDGEKKADDVPKTWLPVYKPTGDNVTDKKMDEACGKGLLFIDELSRATPQVLNVILPLVNEGMFNGYKLGSNWTIVVASNRAEDEMSGQSDVGNALANRFAQVYYEPTVNTWRKWADNQNFISPLLLQWLSMPESENMSGAKFYYMDPNETIDSGDVTRLMCTPRSWTNAMRELASYAETGSLEGFTIFDIDKDIIASVLNQYVPAVAIDSFLSFLEVISKIGNFDHAVHDIWSNAGKNFKLDKKDLNLIALPLSQLIVSAHGDKLPSEQEMKNLATWLVAQNSDQLASYTLDVIKNVFGGMFTVKSYNDVMFIMADRYKQMKAAGEDNKLKIYINEFKPFLDKWKITIDEMPDWYPALKIIGAKYKDSFKSAIVDGHVDALG